MFKSLIKSVEQALITAQVRGVLLYHARVLKKPVYYSEIATALRLPVQWGVISLALREIAEDDHKNGRPLLSSLATNKQGLPGAGYWALMVNLGYLPTPEENLPFWTDQVAAVLTNY